MGYTGEQKREYQRKWVAKRRAEFFTDKSCEVCGSTESLELDHINPEEKISHNIWSWKESRRIEELAKCQVLCKAHHASKSLTDIQNRIGKPILQHGTAVMYDKHECRCSECRAASTIKRRRFARNPT